MKKKVVSILLSLCMAVSLLPTTARATNYSNSSIIGLEMKDENTIKSVTVQFSTTGTYVGGNSMLVVHVPNATVSTQSSRIGNSENDLSSFSGEPHSAGRRLTSGGTDQFTVTSEEGFPKNSVFGQWIYYNGAWVCDQVWNSSTVQNMVNSYLTVYDMYAGDYTPAASEAEAEADENNPNKVYFYEKDSKLYLTWNCPTKGTLIHHKTDGSTQRYTDFTRFYCEAYISAAESSANVQQSERFTATGGGDLNVGDLQQNSYCSKNTTEPWIQVGQWLKTNASALPSGNLWIRVSACNGSNQLGNVIFWINAGEISKLVPGNDLYVSASGNDSTGDGTREKPYATIAKAYAVAATNGDRIVVLDDLTINSAVTFGANKSVTITSDGDTAHTLFRGSSFTGVPLTVTKGSVTLKNIVVDGNGSSVDGCKELAVVTGNGAVLTLGEGAVLQNNKAADGVGGVYVNNSGKLVMDGGAIQNCQTSGDRTVSSPTTTSASALLVDQGKWEMKGESRITGNTGTSGTYRTWGTVTIVRTSAEDCVMSGGIIENNTGSTTGGIFLSYIDSAGSMTLTGGTIQKNTGNTFGGINVYHSTCVLRLGGSDTPIVIKDNKGKDGATNNLNMSAQQLKVTAAPAQDSEIGISATLNQTFATATSADIAQSAVHAFFSDQGLTAKVTASGSNLQLTGISRLYVSASSGNDTSGDGTKDKPYATLGKAYGSASAAGESYIYVMDDLTIDSTVTFGANKGVAIAGDPEAVNKVTIKNGQNNAPMLTVSQGSVTFENITLDGQKDTINPAISTDVGNTHALVSVTGGTVTLGEGAVLQNNNGGKNLSASTAGAVLLTSGTLNMKADAAIRDCQANEYGGAILVGDGSTPPVFNMEGGSITGNKTLTESNRLDYGGNVYIWNGTMNMTGGSITGNAVTRGGGAGVLFYSGTFNLSGDSVINHNSTELSWIASGESNVSLCNDKVITIPAGKSMGANAQVGVYTVTTPTEGSDVKFAIGGSEADRAYFKSDNATQAGVTYKENALWLSVDAKAAMIGGVDAATGEGTLTAYVTNAFQYAVCTKDAPITAFENVKAYYADGTEVEKGENGWFKPSGEGEITFKPLPVGVEVNLVSTSISNNVEPGDGSTNKTPVGIPALGGNLSAKVENRKTTLTIDPAAPNTSYALVDKDGNVVKFDAEGKVAADGAAWMTAENGKVVFQGLNCGEEYTIVAAPTENTMPTDDDIKTLANNAKVAVKVTTPADTFRDVDPDAVTNVPTGSGKSNITVDPTVNGQQYAVVDPATGETVGEWKASTGGALTFEVDATKDYVVVTRTGAGSVPGEGVAVSAASGAMKIDIHSEALTGLKLASGVYSYELGNAEVTGAGGKTFEIGVDTGYFTVDTTALPAGCTLYSSLTTNGVLATSGVPRVGANYTYLQFKCGENVSGSVLQQYLRRHVTFHRPAGLEQKVTVLAENVELPIGTEAFMGHYYQFVADSRSIWTGAYAQAKGKTFNGLTGYLLTVTDKNEHNYIYQKFNKNGWMAATRSVPANGYDKAAFTLGGTLSWVWKWACGPEADTVIGTQYANSKGMRASSYANWHSGEPNGRYVPGTAAANEGFGQYGYGSYGRWNDLPDRVISGIQGYYVEFGGYDNDHLTTPRAMDTRTVDDPAPGEAMNITGKVTDDGKTSLTIAPTDPGYKYAVVDEDGTVVTGTTPAPWADGKQDKGALTFGGLEQGKTYHIVSVPKESDTGDGQGVVDNSGKLDGWPSLTGKLAEIEATAVTPVAPNDALKPIRDGGTVTVPQATDTDRDYALVDSKGNLVTDWTNGKAGGLTFEGLDPDETYILVESGHVDASKTPDPIRIYDPVKGVKVLPVPAEEDLVGAYDAGTGKSSITIDPAQAGLTYTAAPVGGGEPIRGVAVTDENGVTTVTFPGLEPNGEYQIAVSDGTNTTQGPKVKAPVAAAAAPERTESGEGENKKDTITLPGETTKADQVYALVDANGNYIKADGTLSLDGDGKPVPVWFPGTEARDNDLTWTNLDPDATYRMLAAKRDGSTSTPTANSVPAQTVVPPKMQIEAAIDPATGLGVLTVKDLNPGEKCTVDGKEYTADENGTITVPGLTPGKTVTVNRVDNGRSVEAAIPAVSENQLSGKIAANGTATTDDDASVTIDPSAEGVQYAVVDADGKLVMASKPGNGGALTFDGLKPDTEYKIVTLPEAKAAGDDAGGDALKAAVAITTAFAAPVDPNQVARAEGTDNTKDKIAISDSDAGLEYAVIDRETGKIVAPAPGLGGDDADSDGWVKGNGGDLVFDGLEPGKTYDVVTRVPAGGGKPAGVPSAPVTVLPIGSNPPMDDVRETLSENGKHNIAVYPSDPDTKYAVVDTHTGRVVAPINGGSGDGWVTGNGGQLELGPLPEGDYAVVSVPKAAEDNEAPGKDTETSGLYPGVVAPSAGAPAVEIPTVSPEQLSGSVTGMGSDTKASITIQPADPDLVYGVVDENGETIPGVKDEWVSVGSDGSVTISGLPTGTQVQVVTKPKNDPIPAKPSDRKDTTPGADNSGLGAKVMTADGEAVQPVQLTREPDSTTGTDTLSVADSKSGYVYSIVDTNTGKPVGQAKEGTDGTLTFTGLDPEGSYEVKVSKKPASGADDVLPAAPAGPVAVPTVGAEDIEANAYVEGSPATASIAITDPRDGVAYGVKGSDGKLVWADAQGVIKGLTPDAEYTVFTKPANAPDSAAVKGGAIKTPAAPIEVGRGVDGTNAAKDTLTFTVESGKSYAVVDSDGNFYDMDGSTLAEGSAWKNGTGSEVTVKGLDPSKTYKVLVKDPAVPNAIPSAAESKPNGSTTVPANSVTAAVDGQGTAGVTVNPSVSGKNYVVVDKNNKVVAAGSGNGGALTFSGKDFPGILPGQKYTVALVDAPASVGDTVTPSRGAKVNVPVAVTNGVTTGVDPTDSGKRTITVQPTNPGVDYVLVKPDGAQVGSAIPGSDDHGPVTFDGLDANTQYHVVTVPHGATYTPATPDQPAVRTPSAGIKIPTEVDVTGARNSITVNPALEGQGYNLMDSDGKLVGQWVPGNGKSVTFEGLSPNSTYTVVVMQPDADSATAGKQPSGIAVGPAVTTSSGSSSSGGSGSNVAASSVKVKKNSDGTVTLSPSNPKSGDKVTITVKPNQGKAVAQVVVTDKRGNRLEVIDNKDGTYTFTQPARNLAPVTVTVEYMDVTGDPDSNGVSKLLITESHIAYMQGDNFGLFRPTVGITRAEAVQVFYNLLRNKDVSGGIEFNDVPADKWYVPAVKALSGLGIVNGVGYGAFAPDRNITRAEFVTIAARFAVRTSGTVTFPDVSADFWAYDNISQAAYYGWVQGNEAGNFCPNDPITRAEATRIVNVMLGRSGDKSYIDANSAALRLFPDVEPGYWAYYEIAEATNAHEYTREDSVETWKK